jgi:hypothetical protein
MEKRSRRRTRDLVTQAASQRLSDNEIGCAGISNGREHKRSMQGPDTDAEDQPPPLFTFCLHRTASPYIGQIPDRSIPSCRSRCSASAGFDPCIFKERLLTCRVSLMLQCKRNSEMSATAVQSLGPPSKSSCSLKGEPSTSLGPF